jgi:hypothetical protein
MGIYIKRANNTSQTLSEKRNSIMSSRVISEKFFPTQTLKDILEWHLRSLGVIDDAEDVIQLHIAVKQKYTSFSIKVKSSGHTVQSALEKKKRRIIFE